MEPKIKGNAKIHALPNLDKNSLVTTIYRNAVQQEVNSPHTNRINGKVSSSSDELIDTSDKNIDFSPPGNVQLPNHFFAACSVGSHRVEPIPEQLRQSESP